MLAILASATTLSFARTAEAASLHRWDGAALGAVASLQLQDADGRRARAAIADCVAELRRLEGILSLYDPGTALSVLNRAGRLDRPPPELAAVLREALAQARDSDGAFNPMVQPLWRLYADHFAAAGADPAGPPPERVEAARRLADWRGVEVADDRIRFPLPGMAATLNGIAQGWITDRVAELLQARGYRHVLLDLGEARALGGHPDGRPWRVAIPDPRQPERTLTQLEVADRAVATSGGYGLWFDPGHRFHHILDARTGRSGESWASVTVLAATAARADALSTALAVAPRALAPALLATDRSAAAVLITDEGKVVRL